MIQISKEEYLFINRHIKNPFITICSKRKHGTRGTRISGKTYYCPESRSYIELINKIRRTDRSEMEDKEWD